MNNSGKELIMVCGAARSGTTMLDLMLGHADDAFSCGEIYALFRPFRVHHFKPLCSCGRVDCEVWRDLRQVQESDFHNHVLQQPGIRFAIDSSKDLRWVLNSNEWARSHAIPVRNILIWKDPIDLAYSHWKRGQGVGFFRKQFLDYYERFIDLNLPFTAVNYQQLVAEPESILRALCDLTGVAYFPGKEKFWQKKHHHFFGSAGTARQVEKGVSQVGLQRDFPAEFTAAYEAYQLRMQPDKHLRQVVAQLEAHDICHAGEADVQRERTSRLRPLWYYRHVIKSAFRRHFPEKDPVVD